MRKWGYPNQIFCFLVKFQEDDLQEMIKTGEAMEREYGQYFDETIVNDDLQVAYFELNNAIERVTREALWVPAEWQ